MTVNNVNVPDVDAQRKRKANKLCIISLIFAVIVPAAVLLTAFVATYTNLNNAIDFDIGLRSLHQRNSQKMFSHSIVIAT